MTLRKFIGISVDHYNDTSKYVKELLNSIRPQIITLEQSLNNYDYCTAPIYLSSLDLENEFYQAVRFAIDTRTKYYLVDGNNDISKYPYFSDIKHAITICPAEINDRENCPYISYGNIRYLQSNVKMVNGIFRERDISNEEIMESIPERNLYTAKAINGIIRRAGDVDNLVHIGGLSHFSITTYQSLNPSEESQTKYKSIQELIEADEKVIINAVNRTQI